MADLTGHPMEPVAVRDDRDPPVPVGSRQVIEWHIARYEVRADKSGDVRGYQA